MLGRVLEYDSLKTVLLHLDANVRFEINHRMPSMSQIERVVPLKILHLSIKGLSTRVNNTKYRLGIYRHYPSGKVPLPVQDEHRYGGFKQDLDEFGFPVASGPPVLLPGDVSYRSENYIPIRYDTEQIEAHNRQRLRRYKLAKEKYDELTANGLTVDEYLNQVETIADDDANHKDDEIQINLLMTIGQPNWLDWKIEDMETKLIPFECRQNQSKPPFTCYIQLTITKENSKKIQRFEYNKKLFEAAKQLNELLFGCRTFPIYVSNFHFGKKKTGFVHIYRLPIGFSLRATNVDCGDFMLDHKNFKSIVKNSENLNTLRIDGRFHRGFDFHNPAILNSKKLVITTSSRLGVQGFTQIARATSSLDLRIENWREFSQEQYFGLYQSWLSANRPIGARFCVELKKAGTAEKVLKLIRDRSERTIRYKRFLTVFINESTKVEVSSIPCAYPQLKANEENYVWMSPPRWNLKMRIAKA